ncbi:MAG TPA: YbaK/EbsC family protein [Candidatus Acidoferrales bacterium]|nr:YbaK/EbsC family protein [Candidatus Acidoferrales bacterium]
MISTRLKKFLDDYGVGYDVMHHDPAFTAQELSARMHISGYEFVKVVVVKMDGQFALAALPAPLRVNFKQLAHVAGVKKVSLASEEEFQQLFPDCELGAMPPFGNLYNLPTYVEQDVAGNENIVVNAGTHAEAIRLRYSDFSRLARPRLGRFGEPHPVEVAAKKKAAKAQAKKQAKARPKKKAKPKKKVKKARPKKKAAARKKKAAAKKSPKKKRRR